MDAEVLRKEKVKATNRKYYGLKPMYYRENGVLILNRE